ncbi:hypothetical protein DUNSADRAFT_2050 [Dunaliella salina]|uniref:Nudix hydrolase domain-containing protein n=1 Tax=Dunaliella salina TaxID=3046 RepID=A0ABQ7GW98_DUNSA|nr:hypothetical protein DUNSADRAFT_2050 [Dunaliella salina]|eukprot:KAF5838881.1 hypothetical protein DUNSADRAFT_2050 [Dunaliella salina]
MVLKTFCKPSLFGTLRCHTSSLPVPSTPPLCSTQCRQRGTLCLQAPAGPLDSLDWREEEGAAAGICFYCYSKEEEDLCVLLLKEKDSKRNKNKEVAWTWPGGKRQTFSEPHSRESLRATAARETEEETHRQLTAERVRPLLDSCQHIVWWAGGKYSLFLVHLPDEWGLAAAIHHKVQAKEQHPEALALIGAAWVPLKTLILMASSKPRLHFEGLPLHRVPNGIMKHTEVTDILEAEGRRLRNENSLGALQDMAHNLVSSQSKTASGTVTASGAPRETAGSPEWDAGSANSSMGSSQDPSRSSHTAILGGSSKEAQDRSHTDPTGDGTKTDGTGSKHRPDPMEALSIRRVHGDSPILWPQGVPVSSPQLLPKPQRSVIPSARRQGIGKR